MLLVDIRVLMVEAAHWMCSDVAEGWCHPGQRAVVRATDAERFQLAFVKILCSR